MSKKQQKAVASVKKVRRTPEELREALREFDIETSALSQAKAIGAIYRVATHEHQVNLKTLLAAIGKIQNLHSLCIRAASLARTTKEDMPSKGFFLEA